MKLRHLCGLAGALLLASSVSQAAAGSNAYVFVENQVDGEYFIAADDLNPRFTGANSITKYAASRQDSLGYMGWTAAPSISSNNYADIWLENSPIDKPFIGNRCKRDASRCPDTGYLPAEYLGKEGAYRILRSVTVGGTEFARGIFSDSAYEYFKNVSVGRSELYRYRWCSTTAYYNPAAGQTCASTGARIGSHDITITKEGHIRLESTNALQEIFIDSEGNPSMGLGSQFCQVGFVDGVNGAICKLVAYNMQGVAFRTMSLTLKINEERLNFNIGRNDIKVSPNGASNWTRYAAEADARTMFTPGNGGVYVFLSKAFLKGLIDNGVDLKNSGDFFTFLFRNSRTPQSGYYEFSPSNTIQLRPRNYGISILSKDLELNPKREGKVGGREPPIVFDYVVTTSGPRQANDVIAQVAGPKGQLNGRSYCVFSSSDDRLQVPFSAYLAYTNNAGQVVRSRASCDNTVVSLNSARWQRTPWAVPAHNDGSFYRTDLSLSFPMNEADSMYTMEGRDWMGVVSATGEVRVMAIWSGPDIY